MSDFPWQKKDDNDSTFSWDRRMPWDKDNDAAPDLTPPEEARLVSGEEVVAALAADDEPATERYAEAELPVGEPVDDDHEQDSDTDDRAPAGLPPLPSPYLPPSSPDQTTPRPKTSSSKPAVQMMPAVPAASPAAAGKASNGRGGGALAGGLFIAIIAVTGIIIFMSSMSDGSANDDGYETDPADDVTVVAVADDFMTAVIETDLEAALALTTWDPEEEELVRGVFLTEEVLQASQELAPISDVTFGEVTYPYNSRYTAEVTVEYMLGEDFVSAQLPLTSDYEGIWQVNLSGSNLTIPAYWQDQRAVNMFGIAVTTADPLYVLPGRYSFEIVDEMPLSFADRPGMNVTGPTTATLDLPTDSDETLLTLAVTEARSDEFWDLVDASLEECISTTASSAPCTSGDYSSYDTKELTSGTVIRSIADDSEHRSTMPTSRSDSDRTLIAFDMIKVTYEAECSNGEECTGWDFTRYPIVDYSGEEPLVTWEYLS